MRSQESGFRFQVERSRTRCVGQSGGFCLTVETRLMLFAALREIALLWQICNLASVGSPTTNDRRNDHQEHPQIHTE